MLNTASCQPESRSIYKSFAFRTNFLYLLCIDIPVARIKEPEGDTAVKRSLTVLFFALFFSAQMVRAQAGPDEAGHELQVWTGGAHGITGSQSVDLLLNVGFHYGLLLTKPHGPGLLP